jgi:hypothetical protein
VDGVGRQFLGCAGKKLKAGSPEESAFSFSGHQQNGKTTCASGWVGIVARRWIKINDKIPSVVGPVIGAELDLLISGAV